MKTFGNAVSTGRATCLNCPCAVSVGLECGAIKADPSLVDTILRMALVESTVGDAVTFADGIVDVDVDVDVDAGDGADSNRLASTSKRIAIAMQIQFRGVNECVFTEPPIGNRASCGEEFAWIVLETVEEYILRRFKVYRLVCDILDRGRRLRLLPPWPTSVPSTPCSPSHSAGSRCRRRTGSCSGSGG